MSISYVYSFINVCTLMHVHVSSCILNTNLHTETRTPPTQKTCIYVYQRVFTCRCVYVYLHTNACIHESTCALIYMYV